MALTSTDYADLLRYLAFKEKKKILNNTQINKLLFMCYGTYLVLANDGERLFDEHPKAWPFGPVFPKVYKTFEQKQMPISISDNNVSCFNDNALAMRICRIIVDKYSHVSAYDLSMKSHEEGSPWYQTVYGKEKESNKENKEEDKGSKEGKKDTNNRKIKWNQEIEDGIIKEYFEQHPVAY